MKHLALLLLLITFTLLLIPPSLAFNPYTDNAYFVGRFIN